jgi:HSP20 family protein
MGHLQSFQNEMNRMFNQFFRGSAGEEGSWGHSTWTSPIDSYETDDALVFQADLPGVAKDEVSIEVHNNTLILRGERKHDAAVTEDNYHRVERAYGPF